jgi:putative component of membrane protein insertase Oxa1/YidC/SpoIIIJ protein YidD
LKGVKIKRDIFTAFSILLIKQIWHGKIGRKYNKKRNIICRFYPSCSNYAILALERYGFIKGWILAYKRIKRCNFENTDSCIDFP